jgi:hypothetical protein
LDPDPKTNTGSFGSKILKKSIFAMQKQEPGYRSSANKVEIYSKSDLAGIKISEKFP